MRKLWSALIVLFILMTGTAIATQDRQLDCHKCGQHKAPPFSKVYMTLNNIEGTSVIDYFPVDWTIYDENGGEVIVYNEYYNQITFSDVVNDTTWYQLMSPSLTTPPTKYDFYDEDWTKWQVIVSDPINNITTCAELNTSIHANDVTNLMSDIDCAGFSWLTPEFYTGTLDGNNFTIKNLDHTCPAGNCGLFSTGSGNMLVHHLNLENITLLGTSHTGIFWGYDGTATKVPKIHQVSIQNSNITTTHATAYVAPFFGYVDANAASWINDSYSRHNFVMGTGASGAAGFGGHGFYQGTMFDCFTWNNTIRVGTTFLISAGFIGAADQAASNYTNLLSIENPVINDSGFEDISNSFVGDTSNVGLFTNCYFNNDGGRSDAEPVNNALASTFNDSANAPLSSWDFTNVWKIGKHYPIFLWQSDAPPADTTPPQWYGYGTNITGSRLLLGDANLIYSNWTEDTALSYWIFSERLPNGTWLSNVTNAFDCGDYTDCIANISGKSTPIGNHTFKFHANDTNNNWNVTPEFNLTVYDNAPQWTNYSQSASAIYTSQTITLSANFTDNWNLSMNYLQISNVTHTWTNITTEWTDCITPNTSCYMERIVDVNYFAQALSPGNHSWFFWCNDTNNNWNITTTRYFMINVLPEQYILYEGNVTYLGSNLFLTGDGWFDQAVPTETETTITKSQPLLAKDLDGDGYQDIIILDGDMLKRYEPPALTLLNSSSTYTGSKSNIVIVRNWTDETGYDIMFFNEDEGNVQLHKVFVNSTDYVNTTTNFTDYFIGYRGGQIAVGCGNETCVVAYSQHNFTMWNGSHTNMTSALYAFAFNRSDGNTTANVMYNVSYTPCFSRYRNIPVADYDGDGDEDAIVSWVNINENALKEKYHIGYWETNYSVTSNQLINNTDIGNPVIFTGSTDNKIYCYPKDGISTIHSDVGRVFSNTLVYDMDTNASTLETLVAIFIEDFDTAEANWDFDIFGYVYGAAAWKKFSMLGDQGMPGNLFKANVTLGKGDACAWCFGAGRNDDMMCATDWATTDEENYEVDPALAYSYYDNYRTMTWSANQNQTDDWSEIINRGGVFQVDGTTLRRIYTILSSTEKSIVPVIGYDGYWDVTTQSSTKLYYLDDEFVDSGASINWWRIKPCIATTTKLATWKQGENVSIWVEATDIQNYGNPDFVRVRAILYSNWYWNTSDSNTTLWAWIRNNSVTGNSTANQSVTSWSGYQASGTRFMLNFSNVLNSTTGNSTWVIMVMANGTNQTMQNFTDYFRVSDVGVEWYDCSTEYGYALIGVSTTAEGDNLITRALETMRTWVDLPKQMFWIFLIVLVIGTIWIYGKSEPWLAGISSFIALVGLTVVGGAIGWMTTGGVFLVLLIAIVSAIIMVKRTLF